LNWGKKEKRNKDLGKENEVLNERCISTRPFYNGSKIEIFWDHSS
jgi:hypothetical protein